MSDRSLRPINPQVRIGHVRLKVADLERALGFYCGLLGFELMQRMGDSVAFIAAGDYHHHIGLNTWESLGGQPPPRGTTGCITLPSSTPRAPHLATHCEGLFMQASRSTAQPITA